MAAIHPRAFASRLGGLSDSAFRGFVADLWAASGWKTAVDGRVVHAQRGDADRRLLVVPPARLPRLRRVPDHDPPVDAVITPRRSEQSLPRGTPDAPVLTADDLRDRLLYGVDPEAAERLCRQALGVPARDERWEPSDLARADSGEVDSSGSDERLTRRTTLGVLGAAGVGGGGVLLGRRFLTDDADNPDGTLNGSTDGDQYSFGDSGEGGRQDSDDPPEASFEFELENASRVTVQGEEIVVSTTGNERLVVTHAGGDAIPAGKLVVRGRGLRNGSAYRWSDDRQYGVETEITPGDSIRVGIDPSYELTVLYAGEDGEEEEALVYTTGPTVMDGDSRPQRPDASFEVAESNGGLVVYHESGDPIRAESLFLRGSGFDGAPLVQWQARDDDEDSPLVVPGNSLRLDANTDRAVVNVFWDVTDTVTGPPAPILLGQYRGPDRPLDPSVGGVPAARYDARNTGDAPSVTGPNPPLSRRWAFDFWGLPSATPTVVDGTLFVGTGRPLLYALDATDGRELWRFAPDRTDRTVRATVAGTASADGTVYVGAVGTLFAVDIADGSEQWRVTLDRPVSSAPTVATAADGSVEGIFLVSDGVKQRLHAVGPDGNERWQAPLGSAESPAGPSGTPAVAGETVYVATTENTVAAYDRESGTERWQTEATAPTESRRTSAPVVRNGTVYTTWTDGIVAFDAADGSDQWQRDLEHRVTAPVVTEESVSVVSRNGEVTTLDATDGSERWTTSVGVGGALGASPVAAGNVLYGATAQGALYALDLTDGTRLWREKLFAAATYTPLVTEESLYAVAGDRQSATESSSAFAVYALSGES